MQIRSWHLALLGFLFSVLFLSFSEMSGDIIYYPLIYSFAFPVVLLSIEKDSRRPIALWLWFAAALYSSFDYWGMLFIELLMVPVLIIVPVIIIWTLLPIEGRQKKGAILSILAGFLMIFATCGSFLSYGSVNSAVMISLFSAFFSISAGVVYFFEENK